MMRKDIPRELSQCLQGFEQQGYKRLDVIELGGIWAASLENEAGTFRTVSYNPAVREIRIGFEAKKRKDDEQ